VTGGSRTAAETLGAAVTWLFVPGDRPERFAKAAAVGPDVVIIDLEDAVAAPDKRAARDHAVAAVREGIAPETDAPPFIVRVNSSDVDAASADLAALGAVPPDERHAGFLGIAWPKLERGADLDAARAALGDDLAVLGIIESAAGVRAVDEVAAHPAVSRLAVGAIDLSADLRLGDDRSSGAPVSAADGAVIEHCKILVTIASRLAGLPAPVDSPSLELRDHEATTRTTLRGAGLGFAGRLCIHPAQVAVVAAAFAPSADEIAWARRVIEAADGAGAVAVDGRMVDEPVVERARQLLARRRPAGVPE